LLAWADFAIGQKPNGQRPRVDQLHNIALLWPILLFFRKVQ